MNERFKRQQKGLDVYDSGQMLKLQWAIKDVDFGK